MDDLTNVPSPKETERLAETIKSEQTIAALKEQRDHYKKKYEEAIASSNINKKYQDFIANISEVRSAPPTWLLPSAAKKRHVGIPAAQLTDAHFDEIVDPKQVLGVNGYNRDIAEKRLKNFFLSTIKICDRFITGVDFPGIVMPVSGDLFSGSIHEELRETNEDVLTSSLLYWIDPLVAGIKLFKERFGKVYIPWVVGNHGRLTHKPRAKGAVRENFDWLLGQLLTREFREDKSVTFEISESFDLPFSIYSIRYLMTHGDSFRGGSGISGLFSPMLIGDARKRKKQQSVKQPYDVLIIGHWHQLIQLDSLIVGGSVRGYDEFSMKMNYNYEPPQLAFWLTDPEHGVILRAPIFVKSELEQWEQTKFEGNAKWLKEKMNQ